MKFLFKFFLKKKTESHITSHKTEKEEDHRVKKKIIQITVNIDRPRMKNNITKLPKKFRLTEGKDHSQSVTELEDDKSIKIKG